MKLNRILVPVDFSECSKGALQYALEVAEKLNAAVAVLHVHWSPPPYAGSWIASMKIPETGQSLADYSRSSSTDALKELISTQTGSAVRRVQPIIKSGMLGTRRVASGSSSLSSPYLNAPRSNLRKGVPLADATAP